MFKSINVEAENLELILENSHGDTVIIPANKRNWVKQKLSEGCHSCIDSLVETLPIASQYAQDGSVYPPNKKVQVYNGDVKYNVKSLAPRVGSRRNEDGTESTHLMTYSSGDNKYYAYPTLFQNDKQEWQQLDDKDDWAAFKEAKRRKEVFEFDDEKSASEFAKGSWKNNYKEYDISSPEYKNLYDSGKLMSYDKNTDTYIATPLKEVTITAEAPQWLKDKKNKKVNKINFWESLNYKKWGLNDYSDYSSFNSAFRNARESNEKEFVYKDNRYNTNLISKEQSDLYHESKQFLIDYYKNNDFKPINTPYDIKDKYIKSKYGVTWLEYYDQVKDSDDYDINSENFDKIRQRLDELDTYNKDFDNDENYKIFVDNYIKSEKEIELNNLQDPYYFSITDQKPKDLEVDGYLNSGSKKIFLTTNSEKDKLNTTYVHELSHKADDHSVYSRTPKIDIDYINKNRDVYPLNNETFNYLQDPSEIEARKMALLFFAYKNKIDITKINDSEFDKFYTDNFDKFPYDIKQLFNLYSFQRKDLLKYIKNDFSYLQSQNQNKTEQ